MGNPWTVRRLKEICKEVDPDIVFLSETKNLHKVVARKTERLGFSYLKTITPHGRGGGDLALLWKEGINLEIISSCKNYFDTKLIYEGNQSYATFVYGDPNKKKRKIIWEYLTALTLIRDSPWILTGDFNDITGNSEKEGGPERTVSSFNDFRTFLAEGDLYDLQHTGNCLSWRGKRKTHDVKYKLDRSLSNSSWAELYPSGRCEYMHFEASDHRPLITYFEPTRRKSKGIFRYDRRLSKNANALQLFEDTWNADEQLRVKQKIDRCRTALIRDYGDPNKKKRKIIWEYLTALALIRDSPWILTGDFNDITGNSEKEGGPERTVSSFNDFRTFLAEGDLYDLQHTGNCLSWRGKRKTHDVKYKLDRSLSNSSWAELYPSGRCEYMHFEASDHRPLITYFEPTRRKSKGIFRYDRRLSKNANALQLVEDTWNADEECR